MKVVKLFEHGSTYHVSLEDDSGYKTIRGDKDRSDATVHPAVTLSARSRSEQAPGNVFHPRDKNNKIDCGFLGPSWCNIKLDPER